MTYTWKKFEQLVARIHETLDPELYEVQQNAVVTEPGGGSHQVDVLLKPKGGFGGLIFVSCKSGGTPVGVGHVREWADVVQSMGAAAGVIVALAGFTSEAKRLAAAPGRRLTLWVPRRLTVDDFKPDEASEIQEDGTKAGYICGVRMKMVFHELRPKPDTAKLDVERVGSSTGKTVAYQFSLASRDDWYLRDERDRVVGNLWDQYVQAATGLEAGGVAGVVPPEPQFLVLGGVRLRFNSFTMEIEVIDHHRRIDVDLTADALGYENAVTGKVKIVPLPASVIDIVSRDDGGG